MRLLIIDDDLAHGESLADFLDSNGHEAYFARNFAEACWFLDLFRFQVALIDYEMPELKGPEVVRRLREHDANLKAIIMSAREPHDELRAELASLPFLPKPISTEELLETITRVAPAPSSSAPVLWVSFALEKLDED